MSDTRFLNLLSEMSNEDEVLLRTSLEYGEEQYHILKLNKAIKDLDEKKDLMATSLSTTIKKLKTLAIVLFNKGLTLQTSAQINHLIKKFKKILQDYHEQPRNPEVFNELPDLNKEIEKIGQTYQISLNKPLEFKKLFLHLIPDTPYIVPILNRKTNMVDKIMFKISHDLLIRERGKKNQRKQNMVYEIRENMPLTSMGNFGTLYSLIGKTKKFGKQKLERIYYGKDTDYNYLDKIQERETALPEIKMINQIPHMHAKTAIPATQLEAHIIMRAIPNTDLETILYDPEAQIDITESKISARDFILDTFIKLMSAYQNQIPATAIQHLDVKPANIRVTITEQENDVSPIKDFNFIDFGLSRSVGKPNDRVLGTYVYMCPEMLVSANITSKTDIYSLGILFIEMSMGFLGEIKRFRAIASPFSEQIEKYRKTKISKTVYKETIQDYNNKLIAEFESLLRKTDFFDEQVKQLVVLLQKMLNHDLNDRFNSEEVFNALKVIEQIQKDYLFKLNFFKPRLMQDKNYRKDKASLDKSSGFKHWQQARGINQVGLNRINDIAVQEQSTYQHALLEIKTAEQIGETISTLLTEIESKSAKENELLRLQPIYLQNLIVDNHDKDNSLPVALKDGNSDHFSNIFKDSLTEDVFKSKTTAEVFLDKLNIKALNGSRSKDELLGRVSTIVTQYDQNIEKLFNFYDRVCHLQELNIEQQVDLTPEELLQKLDECFLITRNFSLTIDNLVIMNNKLKAKLAYLEPLIENMERTVVRCGLATEKNSAFVKALESRELKFAKEKIQQAIEAYVNSTHTRWNVLWKRRAWSDKRHADMVAIKNAAASSTSYLDLLERVGQAANNIHAGYFPFSKSQLKENILHALQELKQTQHQTPSRSKKKK